jgi:GNAT superfamily N-acetyltransferase
MVGDEGGGHGAERNPPAEVVIRWAAAGDQLALLDLLTEAFNGWPKLDASVDPIDYLRWKYADIGVRSGRQGIAVADGRVVGAIPLVTRTFLVDGRRMQAATAWDVAVHPDYRRYGIMMLLQEFERGQYRNSLDLNFGYEALHPAMVRGREKIGNWRTMSHQIDVRQATLDRRTQVGSSAAGFTIEAVERCDERFDAIGEAVAGMFRLVPLRNASYLNWRYRDRRAGDFTIFAATNLGELLGYSAVRISDGVGYLADLLALPERQDAAVALLSYALQRFRDAGVRIAECWLPAHHVYRHLVADAGFAVVKRVLGCSYEDLQAPPGSLDFLVEPEAPFHFMLGDTDLI